MAQFDLEGEFASSLRAVESAEARLRNAHIRLEVASNPLRRAAARVAVWAASGDLHDSIEHGDMVADLKAMLGQSGQADKG